MLIFEDIIDEVTQNENWQNQKPDYFHGAAKITTHPQKSTCVFNKHKLKVISQDFDAVPLLGIGRFDEIGPHNDFRDLINRNVDDDDQNDK